MWIDVCEIWTGVDVPNTVVRLFVLCWAVSGFNAVACSASKPVLIHDRNVAEH